MSAFLRFCSAISPLKSRLFIVVLLTCSWLLAAVPTTPTRAEDRIGASSIENRLDGEQQAKASFGKLPLRFEPNVGQHNLPDSVKYFTRAGAMNLFLTDSRAVFSLNRSQPRPVDPTDKDYQLAKMHQPVDESTAAYLDSLPDGVAIYMRWLGGAALPPSVVEVEASDKQEGITNYFIGNDPAKWHTNIAGYGKATYREVYPGIGLAFYGNNSQIEYDFIVEPLADPSQIRLSFEGADSLRLNEKGDLLIGTPLGDLKQSLPLIYQQQGNEKKKIAGHYVLRLPELTIPASPTMLPEVGFEVESYDPNLPLVIDPLIYSTFLGGSEGEEADALAIDSSGNAYISGTTSSSDFPITAGAFDMSNDGGVDIFVTKLNSAGTSLVFSTYLGSSNPIYGDYVRGIAVDSSGNAYIAGHTQHADFPITAGAYDTSYNWNGNIHNAFEDGYITKLSPNGTALIYSTFLGGMGSDYVIGIVVDGSGNAYVMGSTYLEDFPTTAGAYDTSINGIYSSDVFVSKLNSNGTALVYSTLLGGSSHEYPKGMAIDGSGNVFIAGDTQSIDFPITPGAFDGSNSGTANQEAFLTKLNPGGTALVYSTYLGGNDADWLNDLAIDSSGNAYLAGYTWSSDFPTTPEAYDNSFNGGFYRNDDENFYGVISNAYISKLNANGTALLYSTFLNGLPHEIEVDSSGNAYISGITNDPNFPTTAGAFDTSYNVGSSVDVDGFVTKLNASGTALLYSTFLGSTGYEWVYDLVIDGSGNAYVVGITSSHICDGVWCVNDFPTTPGAFDTFDDGSTSGFVTKLNTLDCTVVTSTNDDTSCGTLRGAIAKTQTLPVKRVTFALPPNSEIYLRSPLTIPQSIKLEASCVNHVQITSPFANALQLTGGNRVQGLDIKVGANAGLKNVGAKNVITCTTVSRR